MDERTEILLREMALQLGTTAEQLWAVLVFQGRIIAASAIFGVATFAAIMIWAWKKQTDYDWEDEDFRFFTRAIIISCMGLNILFFFLELSTILAGLFNPEYLALNKIMSFGR